jgi:hypothetical protein
MLIRHLNDGGEANVWDLVVADHGGSSSDNDPYTDAFYFYEPADTSPGSVGYDKWVAEAIATDNGGNSESPGARHMGRFDLCNWNAGSVKAYIEAGCDAQVYDTACGTGFMLGAERPEDGTIFRIVTLKPNQPGDTFTFNTTGFGVQPASAQLKQDQVDEIGIVPNPYKGVSLYERSQLIDEVRFTNLLSEETRISVFTLNGSLVREFLKNAGTNTLTWNLTTDNNLPIASGLYLIHIDVKGVGETVIKFAVVRKRTQLDTF